jgi:hypothetical protein
LKKREDSKNDSHEVKEVKGDKVTAVVSGHVEESKTEKEIKKLVEEDKPFTSYSSRVSKFYERYPDLATESKNKDVDDSHEGAAENTCPDSVSGNCSPIFYTQIPDYIDDDNPEGKTGQGIHCVVTVQHTPGKGSVFIQGIRIKSAEVSAEVCESGENQDSQDTDEDRVQHLSDDSEDFSRTKGEPENQKVEDQGKNKQGETIIHTGRQDLTDARLEGNSDAPRAGKERSDRQIQGTGKDTPKAWIDLLAEIKDAAASGKSKGSDSQKGKSHAGDQKTGQCGPEISPRGLTQEDRKNQISRSEEKTEQHTGYGDEFPERQFRFHC